MKPYIKRLLLISLFGTMCFLGYGQEYNSFDIRYQNNIKGDLTFIGNNIVNRDGGTSSTEPNDAYNNLSTNGNWNTETGGFFNYNDYKNMQYIDVDGDPSTFSSSTATFTFPDADCNLIRYAGLYWSATYPSETANGFYNGYTYSGNSVPVGTGRQTDFDQVRFRVPGGAYVDITADEILYDGFTSAENSMRQNSPYACYADVTSLVSSLTNPEGDYTVANIRSVTGSLTPGGGAAGGWTLVIVFENPTLSGKLITTFDGFARVNGTNSVDIQYNGFNTIPVGPVNADIGVASLEGDYRITGDGMSIRAASSGSFTSISNSTNPSNNFFNSNITIDGVVSTNRNPASTNTLGYDSDIFLLSNPANSVIPNAETDATFRFSTNGDQYYPFFNSFSVEIIEPNIVLEKRVEDIAGNDITGAGVNLGQYLDYVLSFVNTGNDDATNYTIRDVLPINTTLDTSGLVLPAGVTYTYNAATREIIFDIPDNIVEVGDPASEIRMPVRVAENCFDFIDACTERIENLAYSTYQGVINNNQISDDPSVSDFDNCGFTTPGATNFLLDDLSACDFTRTVQLCGDDVLLDAGDNFDAYTWYRDSNGNGLIDAGDTVITDGDSDNDPSTLLVTNTGTYIVDKDVADPCLGFQEIIIVTLFGTTQNNPISTLINDTSNTVDGEVLICPNDGEELPEIFLCGLNDTELIQINIPDADSIEWERLDEGSCSAATPDCANKNNSCTWNNVGNGNDFLAQDAGEYRLIVNYQNGCFSRFYFNIYKNPLDPQYNSSDIICNTPGNITITNMPTDYEFQLVNQVNGSVLVPYNTSPSFTINSNGVYAVEMRQQGVTGGCVFRLDNIGIRERNFQVDVTTRDTDCNGLGEISISVLDVEPQYYYEILQGGTSVDTFGPTIDNNYTFANLNAGTYEINVSTDDGCVFNNTYTINDVTDLAVSALVTKSIDCLDGTIEVTGSGGFPNPDYFYAIWSYNGTDLYPDIASIPGGAYQIGTTFNFTAAEAGDYEFIVVDGNNCSAISNVVSIGVQPSIDYTTALTNETCFGIEDGTYIVNVTNTNGYSVSFTLTYPDSSVATNTSGMFTDLPRGGYFLTITQTQGAVSCDFVETFSISGPTDAISANAILIQDYTCTQTGIIEAQNVAGGTPSYEFSIDGVNFVSGFGAETFTGLTDGTYTITVRGSNGCTFVTNPVTIDPFTPPSDLTFNATAPTCLNNTSDVTVTAVDGEAPFVFEIISPSSIAATNVVGNVGTFDNLAPDSYIFRVTDGNGCTYEESYTTSPVVPISVSGQLISNITCFNDTDGEISFTVADFDTAYDYSISGPSTFSGTNETNDTISFNGLDDGTYTITVTDTVTNCTDTAVVIVNAPTAPLSIAANETQPTCIADGEVILSATGGWGGNSFTLTNPDSSVFGTNTTGVFANLTQTGTYTATVTDANGCSDSNTFVLNAATSPVLSITPNDFCYDDALGLTLTATVTSGGDGNFEYSLNGGAFGTTSIFTGLTSGTYTIDVRDGNNCTDTQSLTINPELTVTTSASNITACGTDTDINIIAAGGDGVNYVYAVVSDGTTPTPGDFGTTSTISVIGTGDYDVYVRDNNGNSGYCEASFDISISQDPPLSFTSSTTDVLCSGDSNGSITITPSGGEAPYQYSIDGGATYQTNPVFNNLSAANYSVRILDANGCPASQTITITEPNLLSASAAVTELAECSPTGAEVRITNAIGGTLPYEYSFDGGSNYTSSAIAHLLPGTHSLFIRDANNCTFPMTVTVEAIPDEPDASTSLSYECDGEATITVNTPDPNFDYTYELNGTPNTPDTSNIFNNVSPGNHTITVNYISNAAPTPSTLLTENFGHGANTAITEIDPAYCYEPQDGSVSACGFGTDTHIQDGEYSVTQTIVNPYGSWRSPNDHSGLTNGRFLAINVGGVAGVGGIIYNKTNIEVVPNRDITISLWAYNLLRAGTGGGDPSIEIQLVDGGGSIIASTTTGNIPKNNDANDWHNYSVSLNPGANTNLDIVIRTNSAVVMGNDIAIDDIQAFQMPEICSQSLTLPVTIDAGNAFDANITSFQNISCNAGSDGSITFEIENFDTINGFEYAVNGGSFSAPQTSSPITLSSLSTGAYSIEVRDVLDNSCTITLNQTLTEPTVVVAAASITDVLTCTNGGATITASASGGTPNYEYELQDGVGTPIVGYDFTTNGTNSIFTGLAAGDYIVVARDVNGCQDPIDSVLTISPTDPIVFTVTETMCYSGANDASIQVDVTSGNGDYQFRLNGGPWITPSPSTATTHTFTGLITGNYDIEVRDSFGCPIAPNTQSVTINPVLVATTDVVHISSCADGSITVNASGGDGNLEYAFVPIGNSPAGLFTVSNSFTVTAGNAGDYDVYVRDNNANPGYCEYTETVTVNPAVPLTFTSTPTDPECHDGAGSISVNITSGISPYTIQLIDLDNGGASNQTNINVVTTTQDFYNLQPGDYTINITDSFGCVITDTPITINNPDELTGVVTGITPPACTGNPTDFGFGFSGYPTTLGTIEFSDDGGLTWIGDNSVPGTSDQFTGYVSGQTVNPSMRTVDGLGNTICQTDLPPFIIPYPLDDLDITILPIVVNCNELQVTVRGQNGTGPYEYSYSDDPTNFNPATATWTAPLPLGTTHTFVGLIPGRTYTFYVRDAVGCVRQSNVNVNDIITVPLEITSSFTPSCDGANNGAITYTVTDNQAPFGTEFRWTLYDMSSGIAVPITNSGGNVPYTSPQNVTVTGLAPGNYFIEVTEVDGGIDSCVGATENELLEELDPITGTPVVLQNITCNTPGLILVDNVFGGGGTYTYTVTGPVGFTTITATSDNPIEIPANSPAGNYNVDVQDQYGCSVNLGNVALTLSPNPTIDSMVVDNCISPSTLTINATTSAAQILYSIDGGTNYFDNGGVFGNVAPGTYNIAIIDSNGCSDSDVVTVYPLLQFNANVSTLLDCEVAPANNAEITLNVTAGSGTYDYEIDGPGAVDQTRTSLGGTTLTWTGASVAGSYTVTVYDTSTAIPNCSQSIIVDIPAIVSPDISIVAFDNVSCNGADDGTITVNTTDFGFGPYSFEIISGPGSSATFPLAPTSTTATTATFTGLEGTIGGINYTIQVTAGNSCTASVVQTITQPDVISNINAAVVEFGCTTGNNPDNATVTVNTAGITGGSGNYVVYEFIDNATTTVLQSGTNNEYIETDFAGRTLDINVYDDNGCVGSTVATIQPFDELQSATIAVDTPISCVNDEEITITAIGSLSNSTANPADYEFRLLPAGVFQASGSFTGLAAGTHNFEIRNIVTGCLITTSHVVTEPNTFTIDAVVVSDVVCFGTQTGQVTFELLDATYSGPIDWEIFDTNGTPTNLLDDTSVDTGSFATNGPTTPILLFAGDYYVEVTQANLPQCSNIQAFTIAGPSAPITAGTSVEEITCVPGNNGVIEIINAQGGWGNYEYYVSQIANPDPFDPSNYVSNPRFENLSDGTYEIWVIDQNGCPEQLPNETLSLPTPIVASLSITNPNCTNIEGAIEVSLPTGGQGSNYSYQLVRNGSNVGSTQTGRTFSGLSEGSYEVIVTDQWGCTITTNAVLLYDEIVPSATVIKPIDCTIDPGGHITITQTGGSGVFDYSVEFPDSSTPLGDITGANTATFTDLTMPGTYTFTVTDTATGHVCIKTVTMELDDSVNPILLNSTLTNVSCNGGSDGSILANLDPTTDDNPPYQYELIGLAGAPSSPLQDEPLFTNLPAGDYQVRVVSARGCEDIRTETITEPATLSATASATPFICTVNNVTDISTVTVTAVDGTAPYLYSLDGTNFQTSNTFEMPDTGAVQNLNIVVEDANGCSTFAPVTIQPINVFTAIVSQNIAISCASPEEVLISVTDDGNVANTYTFELLPLGSTAGTLVSNPSNTSAIFNLSGVGSYVFRITDTTTGCSIDTVSYDIAPYDLIEVDLTSAYPLTCFDDNGTLNINILGYVGDYNYEIFRGDGSTTGLSGSNNTTLINPLTITNPLLTGGNYYVVVDVVPNVLCQSETSNVVTIVSPDTPLALIPLEVANVSCTNDQGEIEISPTGGYLPYDIVLTNTTTSSVYTASGVVSNIFDGLSAGNYSVQITDNNSCVITETITLVQPNPITANITATSTTLQCFGDTNAQVSAINVVGGEGTYQYQLNVYDATGTTIIGVSGYQNQPLFDNLGSGIYSISISDGWSCGIETNQVTISEPTEVQPALIQLTQMTCNNQAQLELSAAGGTAPYEFSVDGVSYTPMVGGNTHTFTVSDGSYQYFVRDAQGCESIISNEITVDPIQPLVIDLDLSAAVINCTGDASATIIANVTGGLGNYSYELYSDAALSNLITGPQSTDTFANLTSGSYFIRVTSQDCEEVSGQILITDPTPLQIDREEFTNISCNGEEDGTITVEVSGGTGEIFYAISPNLDQFDTENTFTDLSPGVYDVIAQDENGCFIPFQFTINEPSLLEVSTLNIVEETCFGNNDGMFDIDITGGTAPYSTSLDSNADADFVAGQINFTNITPSTHVVFIRDAQGCETNVIVEIEPGVNLSATIAPMYLCTGNIPENSLDIIFEDTSVIPDVLFALDSTDPNDMQLNHDFTNIPPGDHYFTIAHSNGCINTIDFTIENYEPLTLMLEQNNINEITAVAQGGVQDYTFYFGDDNNGPDNTYIINRTDTYTVRVVDQNGCEATAEIFMEFIDIEIPDFFTPDGDGLNDAWSPDNIESFPNVLTIIYDRYGRELYSMEINSAPWDGIYQGNNLPSGDYWYVIKLRGENDDREFMGHFTLYR